jgi:plastocyanin
VEVEMIGDRRLTMLLVAGALFAIPLVGCGDDDDDGETEAATEETSTTAGAAGGGETVNLSGTDYRFDPANPTVKAGEVTFVLKNDGQTDHNIEVEGPSGEAELDQNSPRVSQASSRSTYRRPALTSSIVRSTTTRTWG